MCQDVFGVQGRDAHPVLDGFIHIALVEKKVCGSSGGLNGFFKMPGAFEKLCQFLRYAAAALPHSWSQAAEWPSFIDFWKTSSRPGIFLLYRRD